MNATQMATGNVIALTLLGVVFIVALLMLRLVVEWLMGALLHRLDKANETPVEPAEQRRTATDLLDHERQTREDHRDRRSAR